MKMHRFMRFVGSYVLVGLLAAAGIIWLAPDLLQTEPAVIEVTEPPPAGEGDLAAAEIGSASGYRVSYADAVEAAMPAVVNIYTSTRAADPRNVLLDTPLFRELFDDPLADDSEALQTSLGSGVIASDAGHVLTSHHVVEGARQIQVMLSDSRTTSAEIVGTDPESDLAVLKLDLPNLAHVSLASSDRNRVGDVVLAIGNPFGVGQTVTKGIISALGRSELGLATFENFIQTDAAINPGSSGGALVDATGAVIGINTAVFSRDGNSTGIGFAVPAPLANAVLQDIIEHGRVIRGWIGVQVQEPSGESSAVEIVGVLRSGPADRAGLQEGDMIIALEDRPLVGVSGLLDQISSMQPGSSVTLVGERDGEPREWTVEVTERPSDLARQRPESPPLR